MPDEIRLIPTAHITSRLARDRTILVQSDYDELLQSILRTGLRQPIEIYQIETPDEDDRADNITHGLISGFRRLHAFRDLNDNYAPGKFAEIPAIVRPFSSVTEALRNMVEENELHAQVAPWEKGYLLTQTMNDNLFPNIDAAIEGLYPTAHATKRSRLRAYAKVYAELEGILKIPEPQWRVIEPLLIEFETALAAASPAMNGHAARPIRFAVPKSGIRIRRELTKNGWALHFSGHEATSGFMDDVFDNLLQWYGHHN